MMKYRFWSGFVLGMVMGVLLVPEALRPTLWIVVVVTTLLLASIAAASYLSGRQDIHVGAQIVQAFMTSVPIAMPGYFYFYERRAQPHADVTQTAQALALPNKVVAIEASVVVKNLGKQLLTINRITSRLQVVDLDRLGLSKLPYQAEPYWNATDTIKGQVGAAFQETELQWPTLRAFNGQIKHEIEPGESDLVTVTFLIPCQGRRYARVATDVGKLSVKPVSMVWKARTFVDLEPACGMR